MIFKQLVYTATFAAALGFTLLAQGADSTFEDNFKSYRDFDPGLRNWQFRGVSGEVIGGVFQFTGVTSKQSEYLDIGPDYTTGLVRDFLAGSKLKIVAVFKAGPHKFPIFEPGKGSNTLMGIVALNQPFVRKHATPMDSPTLALTLNKSADGTRTVNFDYAGKERLAINAKTLTPLAENGWQDNVDYLLEITIGDGVATGTIKQGSKIIFQRELTSADFSRVFVKAYPGFVNLRMTGQLSYFRADNLKSAQGSEMAQSLALPEKWSLFADIKDTSKFPKFERMPDSIPGANKSSAVTLEKGKALQLDSILGGHKLGRAAALFASVSVKEPGNYAVRCKADWYWRMDVNGQTILNLMLEGNGENVNRTLLLPLKAGENLLMVLVGSGSKDWNLCLDEPDPVAVNDATAKNYLYGSDTLRWNLDRLLDDLAKLKRDNLVIDGLESKIIELRKTASSTMSSRETAKYDAFLDEAYGKVYDAYRALTLDASIDEQKTLAAALGSSANSAKIVELEKLSAQLRKDAAAGIPAQSEKTAAAAQKLLDECKKSDQGFAEGVSKGGSFGRFGWMTSSAIGSYSSGDGLLANQVLSNGAIARQYITSATKPEDCWIVRFRFDGEKDAAKAAEIAALKTAGANVSIQFGYDPSQFYSGTTPDSVKVKEINWTHKKFSFADAFLTDMSLLSPSILIESPLRQFTLSDPTTGAFSRIGYLNAEGKAVSLPASGDGVLYEASKDSKLGSNWILLWSDENSSRDLTGRTGSVPVQVIFQRQPEKIERVGSSIVVTLGKNGALWLCTPFGTKLQPTDNWAGDLPPAAVAACQLFGRSSLAYPQSCREFYRLDAAANRVEIMDVFTYRQFKDNDWNLEPLELAPVPPVLSLMTDRGFDATLPKNLYDLDYPTAYGPLRAVKGSKVSYTLPVPQAPQVLLPRNLEAPQAEVELIKSRAMANLEGDRFRLNDEKIARSWHSLHFPMLAASKPWPYLDPIYREYLKGLLAANMEMSAGYRTNRVWRSLVEPYSGKKYYYSFSISIDEPGDVGVFGDRGYGVGHHLSQIDHAAALSGNYDLLRKLWRDNSPLAPPDASRDGKTLTVDKMLGYVKDVHDWAWMDDGSNDAGDNGPVVDCSQATFSGHGALLRMAKAVGNPEEIAKASYFLAKGQLSLIGRLAFTQYGQANGVLGLESLNVGFREFITPNSYANSPMHVKTQRQEYDGSYDAVICAAFHDTLEVYYPYGRYIWNDVRQYEKLRQFYFPNSDTRKGSEGHFGSHLVYLLLDGMPESQVRQLLNGMNEGSLFYIRNMNYLGTMPLILAAGSPVVLTSWSPLPAPEFTISPTKKEAQIKLVSVPAEFVLEAISSKKPLEIKCNGKKMESTYNPATYALSIPIPAGGNTTLSITYEEIDRTRFMPIPIPPVPKSEPNLKDEFKPLQFERANTNSKTKENKKSASASNVGTVLFTSDFAAEPPKDPGAPSGSFSYNDWGKLNAQPSGGLTGGYPAAGIPPLSLEVKASLDNFSGRGSPTINLTAKGTEMVVTGKVFRSTDYKGNKPMIFLWFTDKNKTGKPAFLAIPDAPLGQWQNFELICPESEILPEAQTVNVNLTSQIVPDSAPVGGSVYYKEIKLLAR